MTNDKMRAEFEAWCKHEGVMPCENRWEGWQAATRRALPDGCVAVPVEPTKAMRDAGYAHWGDPDSCITELYDAMLAARPAQAEDPQ